MGIEEVLMRMMKKWMFDNMGKFCDVLVFLVVDELVVHRHWIGHL